MSGTTEASRLEESWFHLARNQGNDSVRERT